MKWIGNHWFYKTNVESVTVPESVVAIRADAFKECVALRRIVFADNARVTWIGDNCFR